MAKVYYAPEKLPVRSDNSVFLAGSIEMGDAENWQDKAIKYFQKGTIVNSVFNPRRSDWDSSWKQEYENDHFFRQVDWELNALMESTWVIVNFVGGTKSPISLLELGLMIDKSAQYNSKVIVACPKDFWRRGNVEIVCDWFGVQMYEDLDTLLKKEFTQLPF